MNAATPTPPAADRIDVTDACNVARELLDRLADLQHARINIEPNNKQLSSEKARVNRELLYLAHLADVLKVDVMSQYHRFKGENPPSLRAD